MNKIKHYNLNKYNLNLKQQYHIGHGYPGKDWVSRRAREEGVTGYGAYCERCKVRYQQNYLIFIRLGNFREGWCCRDCYKPKNDIRL